MKTHVLAVLVLLTAALALSPMLSPSAQASTANAPPCIQPDSVTGKNTMYFNTSSVAGSFTVANYYLRPGECALYSFTLVNQSVVPQPNNFTLVGAYEIGVSADKPGAVFYIIPASQLSTFFSSGEKSGYMAYSTSNLSYYFFVVQKPDTTYYAYAVNQGSVGIYLSIVGSASWFTPGKAPSSDVVDTLLLPGQTFTADFKIIGNLALDIAALANQSLTWTVANSSTTIFSSTGFGLNGTDPYIFFPNQHGEFKLSATNTGSTPAFLVFFAPDTYYIKYQLTGSSGTTTTTTSTTSTTSSTTSTTTTTHSTSTTTTTTTSSSTPPTTQIPPPPHATSSPLLYAVVVLVIAVAVLGFLLVRRR